MTDIAHFTTADGLRLAFHDTGTGLPLLCLAGLTRNMADFEPIVDTYAAQLRVIRLDSRGRGQSDFDPDPSRYTIAHEAQDALALLDHLGLERAAILGTSRGGLLAMALAAMANERLLGVCLNDIGPVIEPSGIDAIKGYVGRRPDYSSYDDAAEQLAVTLADRFPGVSREDWHAYARRIWIETPDGLDLRYDPELRRTLDPPENGAAPPDLWPFFDALEGLPTALLRGAHSDLLSVNTAKEMANRHPGLLYAEVPDRGHVPFLDEPVSRNLISAWLELMR